MQKILSILLMLMAVGLALIIFLYVTSVVIPILFFIFCASIIWIRYRQRKILKIMRPQEINKNNTQIIDVEYEVIEDNK